MANLPRALDPKQRLTTIRVEANRTKDSYLRIIKTIVDSHTAIQSPILDLKLTQLTIGDLFEDYHSFVTIFSCSWFYLF